jgi:hypothetical protein
VRTRTVMVIGLAIAMVIGTGGVAASDQAPPTTVAGQAAAEPDENAVVSPLAISVLSEPRVVKGADGLQHLAYELQIFSQADGTTTINAIDAVDPADDDAIVSSYDADKLAPVLRLNGGDGTTIPAGSSGTAFLDVTFAADDPVPHELAHRFQLTFQGAADSETGVVPPPKDLDFIGVTTDVDTRPPVVVAPPLEGAGWVAANGCCSSINPHRGATLSIDGTVHVPERFAIDFVQLGTNGALAQGDPTKNESFGYFGDEIHAAADGKVVRIQDGLPEQTPGALPSGATVQTAGGNYAVIDIGHGRFAFYAHMQPGSLKVKVGDQVKTGQVIGLLGNTGNTDGAHLHFHIMDSPSPLLSDGLPFEFTSFVGQGLVTDGKALQHPVNAPPPVDKTVDAGRHRNELPLNLEIVRFGKAA